MTTAIPAAQRGRRIAGLVIALFSLPVIFVGLIDPLEGGLALLLGLALGAAAWLVCRVPVPPLAWIALAVTLAIGLLALVIAATTGPLPTDGGATNPVFGNVLVRILVWVYRLGVLVTLAGGITYVVLIARSLRPAR